MAFTNCRECGMIIYYDATSGARVPDHCSGRCSSAAAEKERERRRIEHERMVSAYGPDYQQCSNCKTYGRKNNFSSNGKCNNCTQAKMQARGRLKVFFFTFLILLFILGSVFGILELLNGFVSSRFDDLSGIVLIGPILIGTAIVAAIISAIIIKIKGD